MSIVIKRLVKKIKKANLQPKIVYAEGWNENIIKAANKFIKTKEIKPILIFRSNTEVPENYLGDKVIIQNLDVEKYALALFEIRKNKGMTIEEARKTVLLPNYLASLMVKMGEADGEICGIEFTTKDTLKPALQIIKTAPEAKLVTSAFILEKRKERYIMGDSALCLSPSPDELANITFMISNFAKNIIGCTKRQVAMLSYSTDGSGAGESVQKVKDAYLIVKNNEEFMKEFKVFGEIQFDAAFCPEILKRKAKNCDWTENASIYIFPNIDAGNIGYKIAQRMGKFDAFGPVLIGLDLPVNDLSRGASASDVIKLSYVTAVQAIEKMAK